MLQDYAPTCTYTSNVSYYMYINLYWSCNVDIAWMFKYSILVLFREATCYCTPLNVFCETALNFCNFSWIRIYMWLYVMCCLFTKEYKVQDIIICINCIWQFSICNWNIHHVCYAMNFSLLCNLSSQSLYSLVYVFIKNNTVNEWSNHCTSHALYIPYFLE